MPDTHFVRLANVSLRGLTLLSKFILLFFLAKFLRPADVGMYGLLAASIGYALYALGLEFYNFACREMIGTDRRNWLGMIRDQVVVYSLMYVAVLPLSLVVFANGWLPWEYAVWVYVLLFFEHMAQELNRILVALSEQLLASLVLFLRSGAWCLIVVGVMWFWPESRTLIFCLASWLVGVVIACIIAIKKLVSYDKSSLAKRIDWAWIRTGITVALPLLGASLALRGIFTFDRYLVEHASGLEVLGPYVLFIGIVTAILSFLDAGVVVFFYPKLVAAAKAVDRMAFKSDMRSLAVNVMTVTLVLAFLCVVTVKPVIGWLDNTAYEGQLPMLYWLLLAIVIYAASLIPHLGLYAFGRDSPLYWSQIVAFLFFILGGYFGSKAYGMMAIPHIMCGAFSIMFLWKTIAFRKMLKLMRSVR